jgi:hypothetical protein
LICADRRERRAAGLKPVHFCFNNDNLSKSGRISVSSAIDWHHRSGDLIAICSHEETWKTWTTIVLFVDSPSETAAIEGVEENDILSDVVTMGFLIENMKIWTKFNTFNIYLKIFSSIKNEFIDDRHLSPESMK